MQQALRRTGWTVAEVERRESRPSAREKHDEDGGRALKTPGRAVPRGIREDPPPTGTLSGSLSHREQGLRGGVFCSQETVFHLVKLVKSPAPEGLPGAGLSVPDRQGVREIPSPDSALAIVTYLHT